MLLEEWERSGKLVETVIKKRTEQVKRIKKYLNSLASGEMR